FLLFRLVITFFFSSRRRHTRSKRDWSSDVCSSDLFEPTTQLLFTPKALAEDNCRLPKRTLAEVSDPVINVPKAPINGATNGYIGPIRTTNAAAIAEVIPA